MPRSETTSQLPADGGEPGEVDRLYRRYSAEIRRYITRAFGPGPTDPEDAVQAAFEKFASLEDRAEVINPQAFLMASARNHVLSHARRLKVRSEHAKVVRIAGDDADDFSAERVLSAKEQLRILEQAILEMTPRMQDILILNRIHGLSCAEIARRRGCSPTVAKTELARALVVLGRKLRDANGE